MTDSTKQGAARLRTLLLVSAATSLMGGAALAQDQAQDDNIEELVITASRVSGFTAPTPLTVIGEAEIERVAPAQVTEILQQMPAFRVSGQSSTAATYANLRAIGAQRTLLLVDGRRHVPTFSDGTVDLSLIPTAMVGRTEVVTGGASASWGSDAVAGVVNLIFKDDLDGLEGVVQGGISKYSDAENYSASLAYGTRFSGDKGYLLIGAEYARDLGIRGLQPPNLSRPWAGRGFVGNIAFSTAATTSTGAPINPNNPGRGQPGRLYDANTQRADVSDGGLVTIGPLRGTNFITSTTTAPFQFGFVPAICPTSVVNPTPSTTNCTSYATGMIGGPQYGDVATPGGDARYPLERYSLALHSTFDVSENLSLLGEVSYEHSLSEGRTNPIRNNGAVSGALPTCTTNTMPSSLGSINININNPFLPASVRTAMQQANVVCIAMGRTFRDDTMGEMRTADGSPNVGRGVLGFDAKLPWGGWTSNGYVQYGAARYQARRIGNMNVARFRNGLDSVITTGGQIACRINTDAVTTNDDPTCVPINVFGPNSITQQMADSFLGTAALDSDTKQTVAAVEADGEFLATWAGPIGAAIGVEYRKEELETRVDAISQATGWQTGNRRAIAGEYHVREAFAELAVPLAKEATLAKELSLNLAGRLTDYSTSGEVTTWKAGLNWELNDSLRLRATQSRDIRAGNLGELFTATATATANVQDPRTAASLPALITTTGNRNLSPEEADTFTAGVVFTPSSVAGLRLSADYYSIKIDGVIATISAQQVVNFCLRDNVTSFCPQVTQGPTGAITGVTIGFENLDEFKTSGWDFEAAYNFEGAALPWKVPGDFYTRVLASYVKELASTASATAVTLDPVGQFTNPKWTVFSTLGWRSGPWDVSGEVRWFEGGAIDNQRIEGEISALGSNINQTGASTYVNFSLSYDLPAAEGHTREIFLRVNNAFNRAPPFPSVGGGIFDEVGRAYRVGLRFKY